jgi:hypothetical protein
VGKVASRASAAPSGLLSLLGFIDETFSCIEPSSPRGKP